MKQDWVDGSVAPMGARSWSSPSDYHSVLVSHGIQLPQPGGLLLGKGALVSLARGGGIGPGALACTCCQFDQTSWGSACRRAGRRVIP